MQKARARMRAENPPIAFVLRSPFVIAGSFRPPSLRFANPTEALLSMGKRSAFLRFGRWFLRPIASRAQ